MKILETINMTKRFEGLVALNNVSFHMNEGEILGLIGPNGAGKTTMINMIAGFSPPTEGKVSFLGEETTGFDPEIMCWRGLSRTFQIPQPFPKLLAIENVMVSTIFGNKSKHRPADPKTWAKKQLDFVEFTMPYDTPSSKLNTVQLKRLDLARALASSPKLLLLDEIASGLTGEELKDIIGIIKKVHKTGVSILIIEHIMQVIMNLCQRLVVIQNGSKICDGPTAEVVKDPLVLEAYLGSAYGEENAA